MSLGSVLLSGFISVAAWIAVDHYLNHQLTLADSEKVQLFVQAGLYTIMALISLFGFVGCLGRKRVLVSVYCWTSYILLAISIISGAVFLWNLFHQDTSQTVQNCINNVNNKTGTDANLTDDVCEKGTKIFTAGARAVITIILTIFWLIQAYGCHIIHSYVHQLEEEEDANMRHGGMAPPMAINVNAGPQPTYYPFSDGQNAYGKA